jgi:hypothetical protein
VSGTNIKTINGASLLGSGNIPVVTSPSGVAGAIQFSDGSAFASDAANFFWDDTNNRLGVGTNTPSSTVDINSNTLNSAMFSVGPSFASGFQIFNTNSTATPVYGIGLNFNYIDTRIQFFDTISFRANGTGIAEMTSSEFRVGSISGARVGIKGSGSTSATTSLLVQNSAGAASLQVTDNGSVFNYGKSGITSNTVFGRNALIDNTTGNNNSAFGLQALIGNTTGNNNSAFGLNSLRDNSTGSNNLAFGVAALQSNTASNNTAAGFEAALNNTSGIGITAIGCQALTLATGSNNTGLGFQAGDNITTGAGNVCIGSGAEPLAATDSNQFVVGSSTINAGSVVTESNSSTKVWNVIINGVAQKILLA